jgi:hypothetical protein
MARRCAQIVLSTLEEHDALSAWQRTEQTRIEVRFAERLTRPNWFFACGGALLIGLVLPSFLVCWHSSFHLKWDASLLAILPFTPATNNALDNLVALELATALYCGPFAMLGAIGIYRSLQRLSLKAGANVLVPEGGLLGGCCALMNFPAYAAIHFIDWHAALGPLLFITLIVVSGVSSGAWIGWQVYRARHNASWFPRYGLGTLVVAVLIWGLLLTCYAPA